MLRALAVCASTVLFAASAGCVLPEDDTAPPKTVSGWGRHDQAPIESRPGGTDPATGVTWIEFTVQGVTVSIPGNDPETWNINLNYDVCHPLRAQYFVVEHIPSRVRFRVDLEDQDVRFRGDPSAELRAVTDAVEASFSGSFTGDPRLAGTPRPRPLSGCDEPPDDIPPIAPAFEPPPALTPAETFAPEPTSTSAPMPTPVFIN